MKWEKTEEKNKELILCFISETQENNVYKMYSFTKSLESSYVK